MSRLARLAALLLFAAAGTLPAQDSADARAEALRSALQAPSWRALRCASAPSPVSPKTLRGLGRVAVDVADSAPFLAVGEAVIRARSGRTAGLSFGWPFELAGRHPFIPNPLRP